MLQCFLQLSICQHNVALVFQNGIATNIYTGFLLENILLSTKACSFRKPKRKEKKNQTCFFLTIVLSVVRVQECEERKNWNLNLLWTGQFYLHWFVVLWHWFSEEMLVNFIFRVCRSVNCARDYDSQTKVTLMNRFFVGLNRSNKWFTYWTESLFWSYLIWYVCFASLVTNWSFKSQYVVDNRATYTIDLCCNDWYCN